jgi:alpha-beta hydrolase superfamily lysophospholipase
MTNSLSSHHKQPRKLILIAGLNNNDDALSVLAEELRAKGHEVHLLNLPGQGHDRTETESLDRAMSAFTNSITKVANGNYGIIAFSTGALYFNLWLSKNEGHLPEFQILLAPAFAMKNKSVLQTLFKILPASFKIRSMAPPKFRRYSWMKISEYRLLVTLQEKFKELPPDWLSRTSFKILIDERDELVDARALSIRWPQETQVLKRGIGQVRLGMYHALFHPDFWKKNEWDSFIRNLLKFD